MTKLKTALVFLLCILLSWLCMPRSSAGAPASTEADKTPSRPEHGEPCLWLKVQVPRSLLAQEGYAGDIRIGDLDGDGEVEFILFRSKDVGMKPCFLGAFDTDGRELWHAGANGEQPARPGPVTVHDFDGDGRAEVLCFFIDPGARAEINSLENIVIQLRDGQTGRIIRQAAPHELRRCSGEGANWVHQRLLVGNLRGANRPRDFVVKLGSELLAFSDELNLLWSYQIKWNEYGQCSAYIPAVGDIDADNRDEVSGGYYVLDDDGRPLWERQIAPHMDSVAIVPWDNGNVRAICSGHGHVLDSEGNVILCLGKELVPHGQEVRVADFEETLPGPEMIIRNRGHSPHVIVVANSGRVINRFVLNDSPNHTGMEVLLWNGPDKGAALYNGGALWRVDGKKLADLPGLPDPVGPEKMGWYHCIPANVCSDEREEAVIYNPWDRYVWIFTPAPVKRGVFTRYRPGPRQYNARLMD